MYRCGNQFYAGDGIVKSGIEHTIETVGALAHTGMADTDRQIIRLRYGLAGSDTPNEEKTQKEVADMMGISQSYISRLEKRIIVRLKKEILKMS